MRHCSATDLSKKSLHRQKFQDQTCFYLNFKKSLNNKSMLTLIPASSEDHQLRHFLEYRLAVLLEHCQAWREWGKWAGYQGDNCMYVFGLHLDLLTKNICHLLANRIREWVSSKHISWYPLITHRRCSPMQSFTHCSSVECTTIIAKNFASKNPAICSLIVSVAKMVKETESLSTEVALPKRRDSKICRF